MRPLPASRAARRSFIAYDKAGFTVIRRLRRPTASRTNHAEPPRRALSLPSTSVSIIDARGAEKTSHTNKKVIFVLASASCRYVEISPIHVDNGPSGCTAPCSPIPSPPRPPARRGMAGFASAAAGATLCDPSGEHETIHEGSAADRRAKRGRAGASRRRLRYPGADSAGRAVGYQQQADPLSVVGHCRSVVASGGAGSHRHGDRRRIADRPPYRLGRSRRSSVEARSAGCRCAATGRARAQDAAGDRRLSRADCRDLAGAACGTRAEFVRRAGDRRVAAADRVISRGTRGVRRRSVAARRGPLGGARATAGASAIRADRRRAGLDADLGGDRRGVCAQHRPPAGSVDR